MMRATISLTNGYGSYCTGEECQLTYTKDLRKDENEDHGNEHTLFVEICTNALYTG